MSKPISKKYFEIDPNYDWESQEFLAKSIEIVKETREIDLSRFYDKPPERFLEILTEMVDK